MQEYQALTNVSYISVIELVCSAQTFFLIISFIYEHESCPGLQAPMTNTEREPQQSSHRDRHRMRLQYTTLRRYRRCI